MVTASTMSTLAAAESFGPTWSGVPSAAGVVGTALGAAVLTMVMERWGRRAGLVAGYAVGAIGGILAVLSSAAAAMLVAGMLLLGFGNSAAQLSRYAATDLNSGRPGRALATVVWAGTIGAVGGPLLLAPVSDAATAAGRPAATGVFLLVIAAVAVSALTATTLPPGTRVIRSDTNPPKPPMRLALTAMLVAQIVMAAIMTAAPLDIHQRGHGLHMTGAMVSVHTFGMFALAPLTGMLCDRFGGRMLITAGLVLLTIAAAGSTVASALGVPVLALVLFLLGYGWNLAYIGGSSLISSDLPDVDQMRQQGAVESKVWGGSALATLLSTVGFAAGGYGLLAALSLGLLVVPAALLLGPRR
ncbi:MFS transporter [Nocardia sp. CA-107356]|uniref:MFS transporter n=1 Tax=Nocardia sp. CA-107356 TaxID=3239972 RepID=UPI003D8A65DA